MTTKTRVLLVDDDENLLNAVRRVLRNELDLDTAQGAAEALRMLETNNNYAVIVSDQNMPDMKGAVLLSNLAKRWPLMVRVMLTGNDDQKTAMTAVNDGRVFRFIRKPCEPDDLLRIIREADQHHQILAAEKTLLEQTLSGSVKVLVDVLELTRPEIFKKSKTVQGWVRAIAHELALEKAWQLDLAAMLFPLGMITLPEKIIESFSSGYILSEEEQAQLDQTTQTAHDLIQNIPRLKNVAKAIFYSRKGFDGSGFPNDHVLGEKIPLHARILRLLVDISSLTLDAGYSVKEAITHLRVRKHLYDPALFEKVTAFISQKAEFETGQSRVTKKLKPQQLAKGDVVIENIMDTSGRLLLAAKVELSSVMIKRLQNLHQLKILKQDIQVSRQEGSYISYDK